MSISGYDTAFIKLAQCCQHRADGSLSVDGALIGE